MGISEVVPTKDAPNNAKMFLAKLDFCGPVSAILHIMDSF
jgi:hypothetical protein